MSEMLPEHWKTVRLEEIADVRGGASFPKAYQGNTEGKYPFYKVSDMNLRGNETLMQASNNWVEKDAVKTLRAKLFSKDTVIFPKVGAAVHTNKKRLLSCDGLVDNNVMGVTIRDYDLCIPYYLLYWFVFVDLVDFSNPGPLPSITATRVKNAKIPLPPLPEQRAIAHVLQTIQEAKSTRQRELALERERKAALIDHLFSYGTKGEPRKQTEIGEIPESWEVVRLGEIVKESIKDGVHQTPTYVEDGVSFVTAKDIVSNKISFAECAYISLEEHETLIKRVKPEIGDVLLTKVGTIGNVALVDVSQEFSIFVQVALIKPKSDIIDSGFLLYVLQSEKGQTEINRKSAQSTMRFIGVQKISTVYIPLPSLPEQVEIAELLQSFDKKITALEHEAERLDELFHAMLDELMTGKRSAMPLIDAGLPN